MSDWDSADLKSRLAQVLDLGENSTEDTAAKLYPVLANAQRRIMSMLATHIPGANVVTEKLLTEDSGYTYLLPYVPQGPLVLRNGRSGPVLTNVAEWSTDDGYVLEGKSIRWPGGVARTFTNGLWAQYTPTPGSLDALSPPILQPEHARQAVVYDAAAEYASQGGAMDPEPYRMLLQKFLWGDPNVRGDVGLIGALKNTYGVGNPAYPEPATGSYWWRHL